MVSKHATIAWSTTRSKTNPLHIKLYWLSFVVKPIAVDSALVDFVQLTLEIIEIRLSKGPSRRDRQFVEFISNSNQDFVDGLKGFRYLPLPERWSVLVRKYEGEAGEEPAFRALYQTRADTDAGGLIPHRSR